MESLKDRILELVGEYHRASTEPAFVPGVTQLLTSGAVLDEGDRVALVEAALDMRIAAGVSSRRFEREFSTYFGLRKAHLTNSGSSANLTALSALTSPKLGERQLRPGDEVITVAAGFPTTVNPIVQNALIPVFVDIELPTYNTTPERVAEAIGPRKYIFSHVGYNLKSTDLQAALGLTQLRKVEEFGMARRRNWKRLRAALDDVPGLLLPEPTLGADPSWFGFALTVLPNAGYSMKALVAFLESRKVSTRRFFGGNLTRHPAYTGVNYRVSGSLTNSDFVADNTFWVGVYPGLTLEMISYIGQSIIEFVSNSSRPHSAVIVGMASATGGTDDGP